MTQPVIIVHGGAWFIPETERDAYIDGCRRAAQAGWRVLQRSGTALDAVEAAVRVLEDDPAFDAGSGSYFNRDGVVEMDAIVMDGRKLDLGAVAAVQRVRNPITLARRVLTHSEHSFIVGRGAEAFAEAQGLPLAAPGDIAGKHDLGGWSPPPGDTVGAVALDAHGDFAVATSTGGTPDKWPGRVGDSPLVGCGAYADNACGAAAATGSGETLMRIVISKTACDLMAAGLPAPAAADGVIDLLRERVNGYGGVILIDRAGRVGLAHNTPHMSHAYVQAQDADGAPIVVARTQAPHPGEEG